MSNNQGLHKAPPLTQLPWYTSPLWQAIMLAILIFTAEMIAMLIVYFVRFSNYVQEALLDGAIMVLLILPGLYLLQMRPLTRQMREREEANAAMRESEKLLRNVLEILPVGVWVTNAQGKIMRGNQASIEIWGGARYVGIDQYSEYKSWWLNSGKRIEPEEWAAARAISHGETSLNEEIEIEAFDGEHKIIYNSAKPFFDEGGAIVGAVIVNQDITERKRAESELRRYHDHLEELVDERTNEIESIYSALQDAVLVYDKNMTVARANPAFSRIYRFDPIGLNVQQIIDTVSCRWLDGRPFRLEDQPTPKAIQGELVRGAQYRITCPNGTEMIVETSAAPLWINDQVNGSVTVWHNITDIKKAEERLAYLATYPQQNPHPVTELDLDWSVRYTNPRALSNFPELREQGLAHPWLAGIDVITRPFYEGVTEEITRDVTVGDQTYHQSINYIAPEGFVRIYGVDITKRKRAEEALQASEERLHVTLTSIGDGVIATDAEGKVTFLNPVAAALTGWDPESALGQPINTVFQIINEKTGLLAEDIIGQAMNERQAVSLSNDTVLIAKDGDFIPIEDSAAPILDQAGGLIGMVLVFHDVTEKRRAQAALLESSARLSQTQEIAHLGSWELNLENNRLTWSDEVYRIFGLQPQEFSATYEAFLAAVHPNDRAAVDDAYTDSLQEGRDTYEIEHRVIKQPTGEIRTVHEKCQHIRDETGRVIRSIGMVHDITERKQTEQELRAARDDLERRVQERTRELAITNQGLSNEIAQRKSAELRLEQQNDELRALSQAEHRQRELAEGLVRSTVALNTSLELEQVLTSILEQIRRAVPFRGADIILVDGNTLRVASYTGFEGFPSSQQAMERTYSMDDFPLISQLHSSLLPVVIEDTQLSPEWRIAPGMKWVRSYTAVPLVAEGEVIGIINLTSESPGFFNEQTVQQVMLFAPSAAVALRNAQLYKAELNARQTAETLSAAATALAQTLDLNQVLHTLMDFVNDIVPSDINGAGLLEGREHLTLRVANGFPNWSGPDHMMPIPLGNFPETLINQLIASRKPQLIADTQVDALSVGDPAIDKIRNWLIVPIIVREKVIGLVGLGKAEPRFFTLAHIRWVEALVSQAAVAIQNAWLFEQVRASSERLQSLARKLVDIQEKERYYVARELHDEAGQALSSLIIGLGRLEQNPDTTENLRARLQNLKQLAGSIMEDLHRLAMDLRPVSLDQLGLIAALEQHAHSMSTDTLTVEFKALGFDGQRISPNVETALYRIVQEALTNVVRHAHAHTVGILLERREDKVILFVEDDGIGFDTVKNKSSNLGLVGMRERAELLGGTLTVESLPGRGTSIKVEVPHAG